jgi:hypothetical protein
MLGIFKRWVQNNRDWRRGQNEVWPQYVEPGSDGVTLFQREAALQLSEAVGSLPLERGGTSDVYLTGELPNKKVVVFIYADGAQIHIGSKLSFSIEREDAATPQEALRKFIAAVREQAA